MSRITITNLFEKSLVIDPKYPNTLVGLQAHFVDWMHACGGKGRCTTCKAIIVSGMENITELSEAEKMYRQKGMLAGNERLVCQFKITGDVSVTIPSESKFPHIQYSD